MSYTIIQNYITSSNRPRQPLSPQGMVVHDTATPGATATAERTYFQNHTERQASAHTFIDWNDIIETIPGSEVAWHAGHTANHRFIGVELCNPATHDPAKFNQVYSRAVWYFAFKFVNVLKIYTVNKSNLMSHNEVSNTWHETDHTDPVAFFKGYGKTVDGFRADVQAAINAMRNSTPIPTPVPLPSPSVNTNALFVQQSLNRFKTPGTPLDEDGVIGPLTANAIKKFQAIVGVGINGQVNAETLAAINAILMKPRCNISMKPSAIVVKYLQFRAGVDIDGDWGPITDNAIAILQNSFGLVADKDVGSLTWTKLIG